MEKMTTYEQAYQQAEEAYRLCQHLVTQVQHGLLHLELEYGCDETYCLDCGEIIAAGPCECPGARNPS